MIEHDRLLRRVDDGLVKELTLGVAIKEIAPNRRHVGLFYDFDGEARFLHLGWHQDVIDELFPTGHRYLGSELGLELDVVSKTVLTGLLNTVKDSVGLVPYGIDFDTAITAINQDLSLATLPLGKGMTCATFVAAVLNAFRYMPIQPDTWVTEDLEDIEWQNWVVDMMVQTGVDPAHIEEVRKDVGCKRLRPEQITGACTSKTWPVSHGDADAIAQRVIQDIAALAPCAA